MSIYKNLKNALFLTFLMVNFGCQEQEKETASNDHTQKETPCFKEDSTYQIIMTVDLKDSAGVIEAYEKYHSKEGIWPEVAGANRASNIYDVKIYRQERRLVMILTVPHNWDAEAADKAYAASSEKIHDWGKIMGGFQVPPPGADSGQVWVPMKQVYSYNCKSD